MTTMTVRDLRQRWPRAEAILATEGELVITRDGQPVAKLVRFSEPGERRKPFDPKKHVRWQRQVAKGRPVRWVEEFLSRDRAGR